MKIKENVHKQFELIFDELKKNFLAKTNEKEEVFNLKITKSLFLLEFKCC